MTIQKALLDAVQNNNPIEVKVQLRAGANPYALGKNNESPLVNASENEFTAPIYLMKVAFVHKQNGDYRKALDAYERIQKEFPNTTEGRQIDKYIAQVEVLMQ